MPAFHACVAGKISKLKVSAVCKQPDGTPLIKAAATQHVFEMEDEEGDLVGLGLWFRVMAWGDLVVGGGVWAGTGAGRGTRVSGSAGNEIT